MLGAYTYNMTLKKNMTKATVLLISLFSC